MTYLHPRILNMTRKRFNQWLFEQTSLNKLSDRERTDYYEQWEEQHAGRRSANARQKTINNLWNRLRPDLAREIASLRSGIAYYARRYKEERDDAMRGLIDDRLKVYQRYLTVLLTTAEMLKDLRRSGATPLETVKIMAEAGKRVPNEGRHWVDWVPPKQKNAIIEQFVALPRLGDRGRSRSPFQRPAPGLEQHSSGDDDLPD